MNRAEHLQWCKDRALKYVKENDVKNAFESFQSDMKKHPETNAHIGLEIGTILFIGGHLSTAKQMSYWITGFN